MGLLNNKFEVFQIFPTPVYRTTLNREFLKNEKKILLDKNNFLKKNVGNKTSNNTYILKSKKLSSLKKFIELHIKIYFTDILKTKKIKPYITQSWLNYTETNQYHHRHQHPNSLVSGVFYINADEKLDKIKFFKERTYSTIELSTNNYNLFNSSSWWFTVKTGDIVLFPSSLTHMVETKEGDNVRTSLAFNVFVEGKIGNNKDLTELIL